MLVSISSVTLAGDVNVNEVLISLPFLILYCIEGYSEGLFFPMANEIVAAG